MDIYFDWEARHDSVQIHNFFTIFSFFEFALKEMGYSRPIYQRTQEGIIPDWRRFIQEHLNNFHYGSSDVLRNSVQYLFEYPPKHQVKRGDRLDWENSPRFTNESESLYLLRLIKIVRNNLFHGGKYPYNPVRDTRLLRESQVILFAWASQIPQLSIFLTRVVEHYLIQENK